MNGSAFTVTGRAGDWLRVQWEGREAWIYGGLGQQAGDYSSVPTVSVPVMQIAAAPPTPMPTGASPTEAPVAVQRQHDPGAATAGSELPGVLCGRLAEQ